MRVNERPARLGERVDPARDVVRVDGARVVAEPLAYWLLNKPPGVLTTRRDPQRRPTVLDLLPKGVGRLFPVGRLDRDTSGLLLLTNDGPLMHGLLHPSHGVEREYVVRASGAPTPATLRRLAAGVALDDGVTAPARVARVGDDARTTTLRLTLVEGRKRQIRRALAALGHPVVALERVRLGPLRLGRLAPGAARELSSREVAVLLRAAGLGGARSPARGGGSRARTSRAKGARGRRNAAGSKRPRN